jgi:hypothetical protein
MLPDCRGRFLVCGGFFSTAGDLLAAHNAKLPRPSGRGMETQNPMGVLTPHLITEDLAPFDQRLKHFGSAVSVHPLDIVSVRDLAVP